MKSPFCCLNAFEIKNKFIPNKVFSFTISLFKEEEDKKFSIVYTKYSSVPVKFINDFEFKVVSWKRPEDNRLKDLVSISLEKLPISIQEKLVLSYLKKEKKVENILNKALPLRVEKYNNLLAIPLVKKLSVKKFDSKFFLFFDIGYTVRSVNNIYDLVKKGSLSYQDLIGKELIYDPFGHNKGNRKKVKVVEIDLYPGSKERETVVKYLFEKYSILDVSEDTPILKVYFGSDRRKIYSVFPQLCFLESKNIIRELIIPNKKRIGILKTAATKIEFLENEPLKKNVFVLIPPKYIVKTGIRNYKRVNKIRESLKYLPIYIPEELRSQKQIPTFIIVDELLSEYEVNRFLAFLTKEKHFKLNRDLCPIKFTHIKIDKKALIKANFDKFILSDKVKNSLIRKGINFCLCITRDNLGEKYEKAKRILFANNIISQFVVYEKWRKSPKFISETLVLDIYSKLGIRLFTLDEKLPYDFIIGLDVGNDRFGRRSKAGAVTVFLSNGLIKTMFPLSIDSGGESIDYLGDLFDILVEKLDISNKKILVLRDGNIYKRELENLASSSLVKKRLITVDVVSVKKNHSFRILSDKGKRAVILNSNMAILLPHSIAGARSLLIDSAFSIKDGKIQQLSITNSLISVLYKLTKVNLSTPFREDAMFRLPAPQHYADMFVKALSKNWPVSENMLETGSLYFI